MRLPQELCEAIVDQFTLEDRPTLLNCTLVCRFFAVRAQKILFRTISLGRPSKTFNLDVVSIKHPTQRFLTLINGSSRLATYVEEVDITDDAHLSFYREERSWIRHDTVLHTILSKLDGLRQFSIRGNFTGNRLNFKAWHERLKHTVLMKCQSSLLTKISLNHLRNVPASILTQAPALQSIYSFNTAYMIDQTPPAQRGDRPKLDSVDLTMTSYNDWTTFYPWLLDVENSLDLTALTMFALKVDFLRDTGPDDAIEPINAIAWAVRQCAPTVEFLTLFCPIEVSSHLTAAHPFVDLSAMPRLRALALHVTLWTDQIPDAPPDHLPWLTAALRRVPAGTHVALSCTLDHQAMDPAAVGAADWAGLAQEITRLAEAASVDVRVALFEPYAPEVLALIEERLRDLRARGIVNVLPVLEGATDDSAWPVHSEDARR